MDTDEDYRPETPEERREAALALQERVQRIAEMARTQKAHGRTPYRGDEEQGSLLE